MLSDFYKDLEAAQAAEHLVADTFSSLTSGYQFEWVGDRKEYRYRGDIKATAADGREIFIEVKDDSRIADTRNVLCEEENYIKDGDYFIKGNMKSNTDIYCVVSAAERKIYVMDFKILKSIYKRFGTYTIIRHAQ
jgi:hypothetical protein